MIPRKLTMSAFGPYKNVQVIDFDAFEGKGLFLVTGDTGAGKTSIFDAITYALYGSMNGDRTPESFRSDFADEKTLTYVELIFTHNGRDYRIRRQPSQPRPRGKTDMPAVFELSSEGMMTLTKKKEIDEKIVELLGITYDQWKQVAMLAQGEFRRLLVAETKERTETLRSMFSTKPIEAFQTEINNRAKAVRNDYKIADANLKSEIDAVTLPEDSPYASGLEEKKTIASLDDFLNIISLQVGLDSEKAKKLKAELETISQDKDKLSRTIGEAKNVNEQLKKLELHKQGLDSLNEKKDEFDTLEKEINDIKAAVREFKIPLNDIIRINGEITKKNDEMVLKNEEIGNLNIEYGNALEQQKEAHKAETELSRLISEIAVLESDKDTYAEIDQLSKNLEFACKSMNDKRAERDKLRAEKETFDKETDDRRAYLNDNQNAAVTIGTLEKEISEHRTKEKELKDIRNKCDSYLTEEKNNSDLRDKEKFAMDHMITCRQKYSDADRLRYASYAGRLAETLKEGEPCPVCGSRHHEFPARMAEGAPTDEEIESLSKEAEESQEAYNILKGKLGVSDSKLKDVLNDVQTKCSEQGIVFKNVQDTKNDVIEMLDKVKTSITEKERAVSELKPIVKKVEDVQQWLRESDSRRTVLYDNAEKANQCARDAEDDFNRKDAELKSKSQGLEFESLEQLEEELKKKDRSKINIEKSIKDSDDAVTKVNEKLIATNTSLKSLKDTLDTLKAEIEKKKGDFDKLLKENGTDDDAVAEMLSKENSVDYMESDLKNYRQSVSETIRVIDELEKSTEGKVVIDIQQLEEKLQEMDDSFKSCNEKISGFESRVKELGDKSSRIRAAKKKLDDINEKSRDIIQLDNAVSGNVGVRQTFESYIQGVYFKRVLAYGNQRLQILTGGRYEMRKRQVLEEGSAKKGLDIDILDNHSGKSRAANTLSGGESFKAALALALGLSDAVMSMKGGIHIDTLFVDEGFGSLDKESLRDSIDLLQSLSKSNTLIGIISHMEELKSELDRKIVVTLVDDGLSGSKAEIVLS